MVAQPYLFDLDGLLDLPTRFAVNFEARRDFDPFQLFERKIPPFGHFEVPVQDGIPPEEIFFFVVFGNVPIASPDKKMDPDEFLF
jgi:hypothetical protein